jgi:hypothetical protein
MYTTLPNVLVGMNFFAVHRSGEISKQRQLEFSPEWLERPYNPTNDLAYTPKDYPRVQTNINLESNEQVSSELISEYSAKSMMSLDGLFSPISFYPTPYSATFNITKYPTPSCPFCFGTKSYTYKVENDDMRLNMRGVKEISDQEIDKTRRCPFCEAISTKLDKLHLGVSPRETMPPFIIASGDDLTIISKLPSTGSSGIPIINYATLTPVVLSGGEFSNFQNKQSGDLTGHCIDLVAFGLTVPKDTDGLRATFSSNINRSYADYDLNLVSWRQDIIDKGVPVPEIPPISNNMRFFGLRGPIMVHGWGYDTEGFPVPNSSGEPLIQNGQPVRDGDGNILGKNQKWINTANSGYWSKPYKENTFYKGWAQQPGSWPVGPIDLRWDDVGGVWTVGASYKPVYVVIEEDLLGTRPTRGALIDSTYDNSPLPDELRRLVFVKDSLGMYPAPRGAALYCKYNSNNGFYEPIGHRPFVTSGTILSANTVEIYKIYTKPNNPDIRLSDDPELEKYETLYKNPLEYNITIGDTGLFTFLDGYWTLYSYNPDR